MLEECFDELPPEDKDEYADLNKALQKKRAGQLMAAAKIRIKKKEMGSGATKATRAKRKGTKQTSTVRKRRRVHKGACADEATAGLESHQAVAKHNSSQEVEDMDPEHDTASIEDAPYEGSLAIVPVVAAAPYEDRLAIVPVVEALVNAADNFPLVPVAAPEAGQYAIVAVAPAAPVARVGGMHLLHWTDVHCETCGHLIGQYKYDISPGNRDPPCWAGRVREYNGKWPTHGSTATRRRESVVGTTDAWIISWIHTNKKCIAHH